MAATQRETSANTGNIVFSLIPTNPCLCPYLDNIVQAFSFQESDLQFSLCLPTHAVQVISLVFVITKLHITHITNI